MRGYRNLSVVGAVVVAVGAAVVGSTAPATAASSWSMRPVLSGLNAPRGIAFDAAGGMYVAEAGKTGSGDVGVTRTGSVRKYVASGSGWTARWRTAFTSIYSGENGQVDALGPAGVSAVGTEVRMLMSANHDQVYRDAGVEVKQIGYLYRLSPGNGAASGVADVGDQTFAWTGSHRKLWSEFPDANPYGVLITRGANGRTRTFVADAGANTISEVMSDGSLQTISYIPNETAPGTRDSTPTCIAQGPDGMLYVGALDLEVNFAKKGHQSKVWKVNPNSRNWAHNATVWASGLTTVTSCTFDRSGNFWAAEMFFPNASGPPGDLAVVPFAHPTAIQHIGGGRIALPGGIAQSKDGAMYVTTGSAAPNGQGGVMKVSKG